MSREDEAARELTIDKLQEVADSLPDGKKIPARCYCGAEAMEYVRMMFIRREPGTLLDWLIGIPIEIDVSLPTDEIRMENADGEVIGRCTVPMNG